MLLAIVAPIAALIIALGGLRVGLPAYHHWQHQRALARIELLEIQLGIREAPIAAIARAKADNYGQVYTASVTRPAGWSVSRDTQAGWRCLDCGWVSLLAESRCQNPKCGHRKP